MRARRLLLVLALLPLLAGLARAAPGDPRYVQVRFHTYPPDAQVLLPEAGPPPGRPPTAERPVDVPSSLAKAGFTVILRREGFQDKEEQVQPRLSPGTSELLLDSDWPPKGRLDLVPSSALTGMAFWVRYHPIPAGGIALVASGLIGITLRQTLRRRSAQARLDRLDALRARVDHTDPLVANLAVLGRWRLVQRLGAGGMATVYRALPDDTLDEAQAVAVKVMQRDLAEDPEFRKRFEREYLVLAALSHPSILRVVEWGEQEGLLYLVSEFVDGRTLAREVARRPLPVAEALAWLRPVVAGLEFAHRQGVVHRDLKPDNVMITRGGAVKIMDFGLARTQDMSRMTGTGHAMGTPAYMAPEQIGGGAVEPAADQYALGVMAYELLAGRRPFEQPDPVAMAMAHLGEPPPGLRGFRPDLPEGLEGAVLRMLEKDPARRFPSVGESLAALEAGAAGAPAVEAPPRAAAIPAPAIPDEATQGVPTPGMPDDTPTVI